MQSAMGWRRRDLFVGRDREREALREALASGTLVTLVGPPGSGKSRLAREALPPDTRVFELHGLRSEAELARAVGQALGLRRPAGLELGALARRLDDGPHLFDDAEGVSGPLARLLAALADARRSARVVVTSRERLRLGHEMVLELAPLDLDAAEALFRARCPGRLAGSEAPAELRALLEALDGLPLAIELAAARAHLSAPAALLARLDRRFDWLTRGAAGDRGHASLLAALEWSFERLDAAGREALATLGLFAAPAPVEWIVRALPGPEAEALAALESLRDRSLVVVNEDGCGLLESVRAFVHRTPPTPERIRRFLAAIEVPARALLAAFDRRGPDGLAGWLGAPALNLERATELAVAHCAEGVQATLAIAEARLLEAAGQWPRLLDRVEPLAARSALLPPERGRLLALAADARGAQGQVEAAVAGLEEALLVLEDSSTPRALRSEVEVLLAVRLRQRGELERAAQVAARARDAVAGTRQRAEAIAEANLGLILLHASRFAEARRSNERALAGFVGLGDRWGEALAVGNLGELAQLEGDLPRAAHHLEHAVSLLEAVRDPRYFAIYTFILGRVRHEQGRDAEAEALYRDAVAGLAEARAPHIQGLALLAWAALAHGRGERDEATARIAEAERLLALAPHPELREVLRLTRGLSLPPEQREALLAMPSPVTGPSVQFARRLLAVSAARLLVLRLSRDARRVELEGARIDLGRRGPLARILGALARAMPEAVGREVLIAEGWPGEQIRPEAASTRLRVAIATLRKLGLASVLITRDDGYRLVARLEWEGEAPG
jgi:tetratricopeptide (TPR) repeat protein